MNEILCYTYYIVLYLVYPSYANSDFCLFENNVKSEVMGFIPFHSVVKIARGALVKTFGTNSVILSYTESCILRDKFMVYTYCSTE